MHRCRSSCCGFELLIVEVACCRKCSCCISKVLRIVSSLSYIVHKYINLDIFSVEGTANRVFEQKSMFFQFTNIGNAIRTVCFLTIVATNFYVQFDLNFTSNSTSILRPIRPQFYVQFDLNFTSNSTSILRPIRPQFYVQFDLNFTVHIKKNIQSFF